MTSISAANSVTSASTSQSGGSSISDLDLDGFLKLMIAELQHQDPLDPMKNTEMLQQLSQMRSISSSDKLGNTLDAVLLGQNLTTASSLIGKEVSALTDGGSNIQGTIDRVTVTPGKDNNPATVKVHIGDNMVSLKNVREIIPARADT